MHRNLHANHVVNVFIFVYFFHHYFTPGALRLLLSLMQHEIASVRAFAYRQLLTRMQFVMDDWLAASASFSSTSSSSSSLSSSTASVPARSVSDAAEWQDWFGRCAPYLFDPCVIRVLTSLSLVDLDDKVRFSQII